MSFQEVMRGKEPIEAVTFSLIEAKKRESEDLDQLIQNFIANGGKITDCDSGKVALDFSTMPALINEFSGKLDIDRAEKLAKKSRKKEEVETDLARFDTSKVRTRNRSPYGQNIKKTSSGRYQVSIANFHDTFDTEELAKAARDHRRKVMGLPPAEY